MDEHLSQEELVLQYYGDAPENAHLRGCEACRTAMGRLVLVLDTVRNVPEPPRPIDYSEQVWRSIEHRLAPELSAPEAPRVIRPAWRRFAVPLTIAAMLVIAFQLGRYMPREEGSGKGAHPVIATRPDSSPQVFNTALVHHLERSRTVLVELVNSPDEARVNIAAEREMAGDLLESNRLYRQTAVQVGESGVEETLEDLERILIEISHSPDTVSAETIESLRKRIESLELLFRVRVLESQIRGRRESAALPESSL